MKLKKTIYFFAISILWNVSVHAQYSQGGTPYSFYNSLRSNFFEDLFSTDTLPAFDLQTLLEEDAINDENKAPYRFGYNHEVNYNLSNSGKWISLPNGDRLWFFKIKSLGARSLNLAFDDFFIPEGSKLFIYNNDRDFVLGAFTEKNNQNDNAFATDLIPGDEIILEYYEPVEVRDSGRINLSRVTHGYRGLKDYVTKSFGAAGTCQNNINCPIGTNWQDVKNAVVFLITEGNTVCTGTLINDVPQDSKPYVLTAKHCGASGFSTWVFRFGWESPDCSNPKSSPAAKSLTGCISRAINPSTDMSLVEITGGLEGQTIPASYNPFFAGWSAINTAATSSTCIHHPSGDIKKISEANNSTISTTYDGTLCWRVGQWTSGTTEAGSSGSPLFDQNKRIIGQLYGGPSSCGAPANQLIDYYGRFSASWLGGGTPETQLKYWLDPDNTGTLTMDGTDSLTLSANAIDESDDLQITIYPNPNNGEFFLDIILPFPQNLQINILNFVGQSVYSGTYPPAVSGPLAINTTELPAGIYFIEVISKSNRQTQKMVVYK